MSKASFGKIVSDETKKTLSDINKKFSQDQIDTIFKMYVEGDKSLSGLAKNFGMVPSVMFNILHEIKYQCSDRKLAHKAKGKLEIRSRKKRIKQ